MTASSIKKKSWKEISPQSKKKKRGLCLGGPTLNNFFFSCNKSFVCITWLKKKTGELTDQKKKKTNVFFFHLSVTVAVDNRDGINVYKSHLQINGR